MARRLSLDHLTVVDAGPVHLVELARASGCDGVCLFLAPMDVLPLMPRFDLYGDRRQRTALQQALAAHGVALDLVYPFTLTGRTDLASFATAMDCAAELGAGALNLLVYERDPARRVDRVGGFADMARGFGLNVAVEFYPPSQIGSLGAALDLVAQVGRPGTVGINVDLLHLMRSGGTIAELATAPAGTILYAQIADGPALAPVDAAHEASSQRLLAGKGAFDIAGFVQALPPGCPVSVEIPRDHLVAAMSPIDRATQAVASVRAMIQ
ncbi:TIM barrel protein [Novosphingobium sp.]|uniref:sugar phosphate isomerase/epimerase family protein n=1 Tax=Novosphingobium sp. TaxID=1874826 RepID=UPI003341FED6